MQQALWTNRKFDFSFRADLFPAILERLRGTPARLEDLTGAIPASILTAQHGTAWSIQEHIGHLLDLDELHDGRIDDYLASKPTLRAADMTNRKTVEAQHNRNSIGTILTQFRQSRMHFVKRLESLSDEIITRVSIHPRLQKPMRLVDMALFVAEHDDHHIARMREMLRQSDASVR